ncbi:MAG TPA: toxin-antitoxin system HicB family antitoxin [Longimicrobiales bacterium]|nr:toxin-antitoxin system HicB family antitoxin [Longimicrobiales bacterium]
MGTSRYSADVRWSDEDEAYVAVCPELGGLSTLGDTRQAAVEELEAAAALAAETYEAEGWPLPEPAVHHSFSGQFRVRLPRSLHAWLVREAQREGVSLNTFVIARLAEARGANAAPERGVPAVDRA